MVMNSLTHEHEGIMHPQNVGNP